MFPFHIDWYTIEFAVVYRIAAILGCMPDWEPPADPSLRAKRRQALPLNS